MRRRYTTPTLVTLALFAAFWAYTIASTLIRDMAKDVTYIDLGALFVLGLIAGLALAFSYTSRVRPR